MEEKLTDKYQESIEDEPFVLGVREKVAEKKPEITEEKKVEAEPVEKAKPAKEEPKAEEIIEEEVAPAPTPPSAQAQKQVKQLQDLDRPGQVKALCDLAFQRGLGFAIEVAKALDNAYVLDELHDALVDELYQKLIEQGKLKKL